jgi:hypothetical protein
MSLQTKKVNSLVPARSGGVDAHNIRTSECQQQIMVAREASIDLNQTNTRVLWLLW